MLKSFVVCKLNIIINSEYRFIIAFAAVNPMWLYIKVYYWNADKKLHNIIILKKYSYYFTLSL